MEQSLGEALVTSNGWGRLLNSVHVPCQFKPFLSQPFTIKKAGSVFQNAMDLFMTTAG